MTCVCKWKAKKRESIGTTWNLLSNVSPRSAASHFIMINELVLHIDLRVYILQMTDSSRTPPNPRIVFLSSLRNHRPTLSARFVFVRSGLTTRSGLFGSNAIRFEKSNGRRIRQACCCERRRCDSDESAKAYVCVCMCV